MLFRPLLLLSLFLLCSCNELPSPEPLTRRECEDSIVKINNAIVALAASGEADTLNAELAKRYESTVNSCTTGKFLNRQDYECIIEDDDSEAIATCFESARTRHARDNGSR